MKVELLLKRIPFHDRRFWSLIAGSIVVVIIAIVMLMRVSARSDIIWEQVQHGDFFIELVESGEIRAVNSFFVKAPREWRMDLQIIDLVPEGSMVEKGDFLIQIDTSSLEEEMAQEIDKLKQTEAELKSVDAQQASRINELATNFQIAKLSKEAAGIKLDQLKFESRTIQEQARLDLEKELIRLDESEKKIETQRIIDFAERQKVLLTVEQARYSVEMMKKRIEQFTLYAPISGMVIYQEIGGHNAPRYKASVGDNVRPGQAIVSIPDMSMMKTVVNINEIDASNLKIGLNAIIWLDAYEDEALYHGTITNVASLIERVENWWDPFSKPPSFETHILIEEISDMLKPGMTAKARIILEKIPDVSFIPVGAVFELEDGTSVVYTKQSYPDPLPVKLGKRNDRYIIIEDGLSDNNIVANSLPQEESRPLGWFAEIKRRKTEFNEFLNHIEIMNNLGLTYEPAKKDTTQNNQSTQQKTQKTMITEKK